MNILLVQPRWRSLGYRRKIKVDERAIHPLSLGVVAALSGDHAVRIVDEAIEDIPDGAWDLVGLSVNTFTAPRCYAIADRFRARGIPVVMGGSHTALLPDECLQHADSIVIGDAEDTWPQALADAAAGRLQPRYVSANRAAGTVIPAPRRDLYRPQRRQAVYCQATRGCRNRCKFCYLHYCSGTQYRQRDPEAVRAELAAVAEPLVLFVDDNMFCEHDYARALCSAITPLRKHWWIQAPTDIVDDEVLLAEMARSGCFSVSVGFQTARQSTIAGAQIWQNRIGDYRRLVTQLHRYDILVDGTFIFGFDTDDAATFAETEDLIRDLGLDTYTFYYLTPYPGTPFYDSYAQAGRVLSADWSDFDWDHVVVAPQQLTATELQAGVTELYRRLDTTYYQQNVRRNLRRYARLAFSPATLRFLWSVGRCTHNSDQYRA